MQNTRSYSIELMILIENISQIINGTFHVCLHMISLFSAQQLKNCINHVQTFGFASTEFDTSEVTMHRTGPPNYYD